MRRLGAVLALSLGLASPASAWGWLTVTEPAAPQAPRQAPEQRPLAATSGAAGVCLAAILEAEQRYGIPDHLLLAIGLQEAGHRRAEGLTIWPWTANVAGEGRRFESEAEAQAYLRARLDEGVEIIDVGCLQVNLRWHPEVGSLAQALDPHRNVDYAARFLLSLYAETGDWWQAAGRYHSRNAGPQSVYLSSLRRNHQVVLARLEHFVTLAEAAGEPLSPDYAFAARAPRSPTPYRTEGAIWDAALSGAEGGRRTLYSALDLEPILPAFLPPES